MRAHLRDVRRLRAAIRVLERELALDLRAQTACCGVTTAQCHLLLELERRGPSTGGELAQALGLDKSTLSRTLDGLVEGGLAAREPHPEDGRAQRVTLTAAGESAVARIDGACDADYRELLALVEPDRRQGMVEAAELLGATLRRAREARAAAGPASPGKRGARR
jgi:DNA-binding MarR family transcriptional regulator